MEGVQKISQSCKGSDQLFRELEKKGCEEELNALGLFQLREATQQVSAMEMTAEKMEGNSLPSIYNGERTVVFCLLKPHHLRSSVWIWTSVCEQRFRCRAPVLSALHMGT